MSNIGNLKRRVTDTIIYTNAGNYKNVTSLILEPGVWVIQYSVKINETSSDCRRIACINRILDSYDDITTSKQTQQNASVIVNPTEETTYILQVYTSLVTEIEAGYGLINATRIK